MLLAVSPEELVANRNTAALAAHTSTTALAANRSAAALGAKKSAATPAANRSVTCPVCLFQVANQVVQALLTQKVGWFCSCSHQAAAEV